MSKKLQVEEPKSALEFDIYIGFINLAQKSIFAKNLAVMLTSGLSITEALETTVDSSEGKLRKILRSVLNSVQAGNTLASSLAKYPKVFSGFFVSSTHAGEVSGTLEENLHSVAEQLEKEKELVDKIKGAMLYPIVVLVAAFFLGLIMAFIVLPKITPLFEGLKVELPWSTKLLIRGSEIIQLYGFWLFLGIVLVIVILLWLSKQKFSRPVTNWLILKIPVINKVVKNANLVRFCRTLGTLLKSGLNIDEALQITSQSVGNYFYQLSVENFSKRVSKGVKLGEEIRRYEKQFPLIVSRMVDVGEKTGDLEDTLLYLADYYQKEVDNATKSLATAIEPVLLIIIGLVVAFLALSIITPIYDITGSIRR